MGDCRVAGPEDEVVLTPVQLWVDNQDTAVPAPVTRGLAAAAGWTAAAVTVGSVSLVCLATWEGAVHELGHRRYAQWDVEWSLVEPHWSKRLPN